jgi:predicted DNA-binding mobile mystery protein A
MGIKNIVKRQYAANVNSMRKRLEGLQNPSEGWIKTMRKALGMSGAQLARRLKVSRATVSNAEKAELTGSITVKRLEEIAAAMDCRVVYSFVPNAKVEDIIRNRAVEKASKEYDRVSVHMALESQQLGDDHRTSSVDEMVREFIANDRTLWNE